MGCGCGSEGSGHSCGSTGGCGHSGSCSGGHKLEVFDWLSDVEQPAEGPCKFVEVRFKNDRKHFFQNTNDLPVHIGSVVTVAAASGHDVGVVTLTGELVKIQMKKKKAAEEDALKIYRIATAKDIDTWQEFRKKENTVKIEARKLAKNLDLQMKISDIEYQGDGSKITFYYTAEKRIDFRQLIKDYAMAFHAKIDMKQIGFRQEAAKIGGIGTGGRELCCSTWLTDFRSVNTQAARYQQLSINPQKLAGQCGKLKCCLNFELDSYLDALKDFPSSSVTIETEQGKAFCIKVDVFKQRMWFTYQGNSVTWYDFTIDEVKTLMDKNKRGIKIESLEGFKQEKAKPDTDLFKSGGGDIDFKPTKKRSQDRRRGDNRNKGKVRSNSDFSNKSGRRAQNNSKKDLNHNEDSSSAS